MTIEVYRLPRVGAGRELWGWRILAGNNAVVGECKTPARYDRVIDQARRIGVGLDVVINEA